MEQQLIEQTCKRVGIKVALKHTRTMPSAVTTGWGVDWDEVYIARDLMQNFFDANRECLESVCVRPEGSDVIITAPTPFNIERLYYLGSEKGDDDVGQYGEGFKVAATCLLRDHKVTPIAMSGQDMVVLRIADRAVANTKLFPVDYNFYRNTQEIKGTVLILPGCSKKLIKALSEGLTHFFHDGNPLLGAKRWTWGIDEFLIYDSTNRRGHIFYQKLKRGEIDDIPVVLVINKQYQVLERKISKDRDRNAFGDEVMKLFYKQFSRYGLKQEIDGQKVIVMAAQSCWGKGHPLLSQIAEFKEYYNRPWPDKLAREVFGDKYYAHTANSPNPVQQLEIDHMERSWREEGKILLPGYFQSFGVISAGNQIKRTQEKVTDESKMNNQRAPTTEEHNALRILLSVLRELAPEVVAIFNKKRTTYTIAKTEVVLGQLCSDRSYGSREVFLAESLFIGDFPEALAVYLHEHAHIFGYDGSREFTDALTNFLAIVVRQRHDLEQYDVAWEEVRARVKRERIQSMSSGADDDLQDWLSTRSESDLRELIARIPPVMVRKYREKEA